MTEEMTAAEQTCESIPDTAEEYEAEETRDYEPCPNLSGGGKAHLTGSVPRAARVPRGALSKSEMAELRQLFSGLDDSEIHRLYKKVTK